MVEYAFQLSEDEPVELIGEFVEAVGEEVMAIDAWPSWVWMSLGSAPALIISDAAV